MSLLSPPDEEVTQRELLRSIITSRDHDGRFQVVNDIQVYYKLTYPSPPDSVPNHPVGLCGHVRAADGTPDDVDQRPVIMFFHQLLGNVYVWSKLAQAISDATGCMTLAYDRLGFGFTERPEPPAIPNLAPEKNPYTMEGGIQLAAGLLRELNLVQMDPPDDEKGKRQQRKVILVSASAGGVVASGLALQYPHVVHSLIYVCPAIRRSEQGPPPIACSILGSAPGRLFLHWALYKYVPFSLLFNDPRYTESSEVRDRYRIPLKLPRFYESIGDLTWYFRPLEIIENPSVMRRIVQFPMLTIAGVNDKYSSERNQWEMFGHWKQVAREIGSEAHVQYRLINDCGHLPHDEQPEDVFVAMVDFLNRTGI